MVSGAASCPLPIATRQMNITERSSKDDIIGAACELSDAQQSRIELLEGQQRIFLAVIITLAVKIFVF
jgi:hypothetical protein